MKLTVFLILISVAGVWANKSYSQSKMLNLNMQDASVKEVINSIEEQSEFYFLYSENLINVDRKVNINIENQKIEQTLNLLFKGTNIDYSIRDRIIVLTTSEVTGNNPMLVPQKSVSGTVKDKANQPLPGVTIIVKGTTQGTVTNADGKYLLSDVADDAVLQFSFIGMKTQEIPVNENTNINIILEPDAIGLEEVVAIGYGTTTKRKAVGAITSITAEALEQTPYSNTSQALQGQVPGVIVHGSGGAPGDIPSISIRGGETPLFVIDGVVQDEYAFSVLNPDDIETITFLKDAASTAIYGSRAGDGIVLVKTKRGANNKLQMRYSANYQLSQPTMMPDLMDATEWALMHNDAARFDEIDPIFSDEQLRIIANGEDPIAYANTDWQEETLKDFAEQQRHNFSLTGGDTKTNYFVSLGYLNNNGIFKANSMSLERFNMRSNVSTSFEKIDLDVSLNIDGSVQNLREPSAGEGRLFREISYMSSPHQPVRNPDGTYAAGGNPTARADKGSGYSKERRKVINTQLDLRWKVPGIKGLVAGVMGAYKDGDGFDKRWALTVPLYEPDGTVAPSLAPSLAQTMFYTTTVDFEGSLAYTNIFGKHGVDATVVYTQRTGYYEEMEGSRLNYESSAVDMLFAGPSAGQDNGGLARESALAGVVGRVQYDFDQKYIVQLSGRYDGNDNFAPGKKWGFFPAIATGWVISSEPFMEGLNDKIKLNNLKLRLSYGETGITAGVNRFGYLATYNLVSNAINIGNSLYNGFSEGNLVSPNELSWYSRNSSNIGLDFAFLENSLEGTLDYFYYKTSGYLVSPEDSYSTPLGKDLPQIKSDSEHRRAGLEASLRYKKKINDVFFSIGANCTYYDQLWATKADEDMASLKNPYVRETQQKDFFRSVYLADGYYQDANEVLNTPRPTSASAIQMGDLKYIDANGDGKIDDDDRRRVGKPDSPHFTYGIDFKVDYKGWSLNGLVQGTGDRYVDNGFNNEIPKDRLVEFTLDYWDEDNPNARFPRISTNWDNPNGLASTHSTMNARYIRLKNLQLAYDLKHSLLKNSHAIAGFKLFVTGTNLLTSSDVMDLFDPESWMPSANSSGGGVRAGASYPVQRTYTFGLNVEF